MLELERSGLVLLVMDFQNDFAHRDGLYSKSGPGFEHVPAAVENLLPTVLKVVGECKRREIPIVATKLLVLADRTGHAIGVEQFRPNLQSIFETEGFRRNTRGQALIDELQDPAYAPDFEVDKWGHSAMYLTGLEKVLRALDARTLVFVGLATNGVVEGTARDAVSRGWKLITLSDCVTAPYPELHAASMLNLEHLGQVATSAEFLDTLAAS